MKPYPEQVQQLIDWIEEYLEHDDLDQYFFQVFEDPFDKTKLLMGRNGINVEVQPSAIAMATDLEVIYKNGVEWYVYTIKKKRGK